MKFTAYRDALSSDFLWLCINFPIILLFLKTKPSWTGSENTAVHLNTGTLAHTLFHERETS